MSASSSSSSSSKPSNKKKIYVMSTDGETFVLTKEAALMSQAIKFTIEDECADTVIPLNVTSSVLSKIVQYCNKHSECSKKTDQASEDDLNKFDDELANAEDPDMFGMIEAANYLNIPKLQDLLCQSVAKWMKGRRPEEVRAYFNIINDFTPEEEEKVRRETYWAHGENP